MFFVTADVASGQSFAAVMGSFGLDEAQQLAALRNSRNAHLRAGGATVPDSVLRLLRNSRTVQPTTIVVPIDIRLSVPEFRPVIDLVKGFVPRSADDTSPPICTHGVTIRVTRNLGAGTGLNWLQTVRKLNNPDARAPVEFVDAGHDNLPFNVQPPSGQAAPAEFGDTPCGPIAPGQGRSVDFTAMTTLAVLVRSHIILAAGKVWRDVINPAPALPQGVTATPPRDANVTDFKSQLRILPAGVSQVRLPTGPGLDYRLPPAPNSVVT